MDIGRSEGIGISYYINQFFLFQLSLNTFDRNQTAMLSGLRKQNLSTNGLVKFCILRQYQDTTFLSFFEIYLTISSKICHRVWY